MNPYWNMVLYLPVTDMTEKFVLDLLDHNGIRKDTALAVTELSAKDVVDTKGGFNMWRKLGDPGTNDISKARGEVECQAEFAPIQYVR